MSIRAMENSKTPSKTFVAKQQERLKTEKQKESPKENKKQRIKKDGKKID